eukprot:GDKI01020086.1.p1 GENE.GDKI01020086.1~~GDKI01020086.1.p1  ORF type:complete len:313 (+),score=95.87 GDKI01020086.1:98-940(+)
MFLDPNTHTYVSSEIGDRCYPLIDEIMTYAGSKDRQTDPASVGMSVGDAMRDKLNAHIKQHPEDAGVLGCLSRVQCWIDGCSSMKDESLALMSTYAPADGPNLEVGTGIQTVLDTLIDRKLTQKSKNAMRFHHTVQKIDYSGDGVSVTCVVGPRPGLSTETRGNRDGRKTVVFKCKAVIVTVSLGVLKTAVSPETWGVGAHGGDTETASSGDAVSKSQQHLEFYPPLPEKKRQVIERLAFSAVNKVYVCAWPEDEPLTPLPLTHTHTHGHSHTARMHCHP